MKSASSLRRGQFLALAVVLAGVAGSPLAFGGTTVVGMPASNMALSLAPSVTTIMDSSGGETNVFTPVTPIGGGASNVVVNSGTPFSINLNIGAGLAANPAAEAAFVRAAAHWTSAFRDPVTVTIDADLGTFTNNNIIGSTSSVLLEADYTTIRNQMVADNLANDPVADSINNAMPTAAQFTAKLPTGFTLSGNVLSTKANLKAQGFTGLDTAFGASDAAITFNSAFAFDFDNSNGVTAGTEDFETVATHEIGHALGFVSEVDEVDGDLAASTTEALTFSELDLYRFQASNAPINPAQFTTNARDFTTADQEVTGDTVNNYLMSQGVATGDGNQASHWKDDALIGPPYIGIMDPTLSPGTVENVKASDIRALDLIGWDLASVPEPASIGLLVLGALGLLGRRGKRI